MRKTGETVAIKSFDFTPDSYIKREAETMAQCNHENVVTFFGLERMLIDRQWLLAMELCPGRTLQKLIDLNPDGLDSSDFFRVCEDLVSAIEHLHQMNLVHRDVKPANILISKLCDGKSIYKVADFGAARILMPNQQYGSLYGTYEYVHPDIFANFYRQALEIIPPVREFDGGHELWSVGVTLYETATGRLPFQPKNGRDDRKIMYQMISRKTIDEISATEGEDGSVEWSRKLPRNCRLIERNDNCQTDRLMFTSFRLTQILNHRFK